MLVYVLIALDKFPSTVADVWFPPVRFDFQIYITQ
jgi:hypothetical protein